MELTSDFCSICRLGESEVDGVGDCSLKRIEKYPTTLLDIR